MHDSYRRKKKTIHLDSPQTLSTDGFPAIEKAGAVPPDGANTTRTSHEPSAAPDITTHESIVPASWSLRWGCC